MIRYLINFWIVLNCQNYPFGSVVVEPDVCIKSNFGLAFRTNGSHIIITNNCSDNILVNKVACQADSGCCQVPVGLSVNITITDLPLSVNKTHIYSPLPDPSPGRRFVCTEEPI